MNGAGDLVLRWASESGTGKLRDLLDGTAWIARTHRTAAAYGAPGRLVRDLSTLGYIEVDWVNGRWAIAPTVLTRLPDSGGLLFLTGARTFPVVQALQEMASELDIIELPGPTAESDIPAPCSILLQADATHTDLEKLAKQLGAAWVPCAAIQLVPAFPKLRLGPEAAAPPVGEAIEKYDLDRHRYELAVRDNSNGLYRFLPADRRRRTQLLLNGRWYATTHEEGVFHLHSLIEQPGASLLRWYHEAPQDTRKMCKLVVDWGAPLPPIQARAAVLCSGLPPWFSERGKTTVYYNVPLTIAKSIATSLGQTLGVYEQSLGTR